MVPYDTLVVAQEYGAGGATAGYSIPVTRVSDVVKWGRLYLILN